MGWFLTRDSKGRKGRGAKRTTRGKGGRAKPWDPQRTLLGLTVLGLLGLAVALGIGWRYGEDALERYVARTHASEVEANDVVLVDRPAWMAEAVREELAALVAEQVDANPLDTHSLRDAVDALARSPWVKQVRQVRRVQGGEVLVAANYREPVAIVEALDGYHLVDEEGVELPGLYMDYQVQDLGLPLIEGASAGPAGAGKIWPDMGVRAGVDLVELLATEPYAGQIEAVDVSQRDRRGRVRLMLRTAGGLVRWGLPVGEERTIEPEAARKLDWLRQVAAQHNGRIDAGGKVVDVYGAAVQVSY